MWTRRRAVTSLACLGGTSLASAMSWIGRSTTSLEYMTPDTQGWPSLLDAFPAAVQTAVRQERYSDDLSKIIQDVISTGCDFVIPPGLYPIAGDMLECRHPGQKIVGKGGVLSRIARRDGIGLLVTAMNVSLYNVHLDGRAPATQPSHHNDMVKVTGDNCRLVDLAVHGAWGSNLRLSGTRGARLICPTLTDAYQNNLIICNAPTQDILVDSPVCRRTATQNNIFVTASEGSFANGEFVSRVIIIDPLCTDAGDTGIELGYHCQDSEVRGGSVVNSLNPALLQRDGRRNRWSGTRVRNRRTVDQHGDYDAVAVVPQWEPTSWDSDTEFNAIVVEGHARRSAFYWGQSGIRRIDCIADAYAAGDLPSPDGSDRVGNGDLKAGDVSSILVRGGRIEGFATGDNWNFDGRPHTLTRCITRDVDFAHCTQPFSCYNVTPVRSAILDNRIAGDPDIDILLVNARLLPMDGQPDIGLVYDGNRFDNRNADAPVRSSHPAGKVSTALLARDSRFVKLPSSGGLAVTTAMPRPGRYRLNVGTTQLEFILAHGKNGIIVSDGGATTIGNGIKIDVSVVNGRLVLHQRGHLPRPLWAKISGPSITALQT